MGVKYAAVEEALQTADELIDWCIEGMAPENEERLKRDINMLEFFIRTTRNILNELVALQASSNMYADHTTKEVIELLWNLFPKEV